MGTTPLQAYRFPEATDANNVPVDMQELALDAERRSMQIYASAAARTAAFAAAGISPTEGMVSYLQDVNRTEFATAAGNWHVLPGARMPGGTTIATADVTGINTTETSIGSVTATLESGFIYRVRFVGGFTLTDITGVFFVRLREDSVPGGTEKQGKRLMAQSTAIGYPVDIEAEHTAAASAAKTFHASLIRTGGAGNIGLAASSVSPAYLYVDYIR